MTDSPTHPGLGEGTDISAADLDVEAPASTPASNDADQMEDAGLGTGDGADVQPGGAG
ncbi:MAG: hypothetical protein JWO60_1111 [Frankiales bacterium]|nr:hypothetical protein [Frankiales bacterium]